MKEKKMMKKDGVMSKNNDGINRKIVGRSMMEIGQGGKMGKTGAARKGESKPHNGGKMEYNP
jgi:hypothetical protein